MPQISFHTEPVWPLFVISASMVILVALTIWTYRGSSAVSGRRLWAVLGLRLAAVVVAAVLLVRPTLEFREVESVPGTLIILIDQTRSMLVKDEDPNLTRWDAARRDWDDAELLIKDMEASQRLRTVVYAFDDGLHPLDWSVRPQGERTGLLQALDQAYEHHRPTQADQGSRLRGIAVLTDGRDNVGQPNLDQVVARLARAPCPVYAIGFGRPGSSELQPDLVVQDIQAPQTARIKDRLRVRGALMAQRFVGQEVEVWLRIDGEPASRADRPGEPVRLVLKPNKPVQLMPIEFPPARLPERAGDVRVSIWAKPLNGELTDTNNQVSTYVTLVKEGLSVLYFDKPRAWEPKFLKRALKGDQRITLYSAYLGADSGAAADQWRRELRDDLKRNQYDVFIFGDIPASRFAPGTPLGNEILGLIVEAVSQRGAGLLMIGGHESFGNGRNGTGRGSWRGTPIEDLLPVELDIFGDLEGRAGHREVQFIPTNEGIRHFTLLLDSDPEENRRWWGRLHSLDGGNRLGPPKTGATVLARSERDELLLAVQQFGKGRTAALAVDTTWRWIRPGPPHDPQRADDPNAMSEGREAHLRFWRQMILWLARQEEAGKGVRVELAHRRLAVGKEQTITVQARELKPGGTHDLARPIPDAEFEITVQRPDDSVQSVTVTPLGGDEAKSQGVFWKTDLPGEYRVTVQARHRGTDLGTMTVRFMAYRDDSELLNRTANHALLEQLARATGGSYRLHSGLADLLMELQPEAATQTTRARKLPDWQEASPQLQWSFFLLFVALVAAEWICRRLWGMV